MWLEVSLCWNISVRLFFCCCFIELSSVSWNLKGMVVSLETGEQVENVFWAADSKKFFHDDCVSN